MSTATDVSLADLDIFEAQIPEITEDAMTLPIDKVAIKMLIELFETRN